ncbi:Outer membrane protein OmpA [Devosia sp. YR412]|uniref:OmpA family protein n=1 Tax=Devosia sp. YR412 TaxID=1881030 RepID=UPI0008B33D78|nr:OmpA family protein [Devosia sp. YR412]SEP70940.1 Outer membrane protein OmpA [Devosia sp. YR412]
MIRDLLKWVMPGLATVLGGTSLCLAMTSGEIASDLTARTTVAMAAGGYDWAELSLDARDLKLTGTTTDQAVLQSAVARLASVPGIRSVVSDVTLAPVAKPYLFTATMTPEGSSLSGGVPDETTRQRLLDRAGQMEAKLDLRSGMPEREAWLAGASFAIDNLKYLDQGAITLSDTTLSLEGRAKSERDYRDLLIVMRAGAPSGLTLGAIEIAPALVEPYQWSASFDGKRIEVTGFVPDDATAERFRTADVSGIPVATGLALGSGEPQGFAELSQRLLEQLAKLEYGAVTINGEQSTVTGAPPTIEVAQAVTDTLQSAGSIITLEPPRIADYWMSASQQAGGALVFDGYAPDDDTRQAFAQRTGADITYLKLGRGAPERYQSAADFGLAALDQMSEGRFALRDNIITLSGIAASLADYDALRTSLSDGAPQGLVLAQAEIRPPFAEAYTWQVIKDGAGVITLSGLVPNAEAKAALLASAGTDAKDSLTFASGEPGSFLASAETALDLLPLLRDGSISFDGRGWTLTGTANSPADRAALDTAFADQKLAAAGWSMAVADAPVVAVAVEPEPAPIAEPAPVVEPPPEPAPEPVTPEIVVAEAPAVAAEPVVEPEVEAAPEVEAPEAEPEPIAPIQTSEVVPPVEPAPAPAAAVSPEVIACAAPVAQFSARNAIFFRSGAAAIAAESNQPLDELAIDLAACPSATVHIEGHTDSDGDETQNMALSVARAEAVVSALVQRGVAADRLYAVGYGETAPIADNATQEGKRINRRIVVTVKAGE